MKSKYEQRGAYHYAEFAQDTPYRSHVLDLVGCVKRVSPDGGKLLDIGCGEGLIMSEMEKIGFECHGVDIDPIAVNLGRARGNNVVIASEINWTVINSGRPYDVVLLCDVLEHVEDLSGTIRLARALSATVVVATPDRPDAHADRIPTIGEIVSEFRGWELTHSSTRHARHLMIFEDCR